MLICCIHHRQSEMKFERKPGYKIVKNIPNLKKKSPLTSDPKRPLELQNKVKLTQNMFKTARSLGGFGFTCTMHLLPKLNYSH